MTINNLVTRSLLHAQIILEEGYSLFNSLVETTEIETEVPTMAPTEPRTSVPKTEPKTSTPTAVMKLTASNGNARISTKM